MNAVTQAKPNTQAPAIQQEQEPQLPASVSAESAAVFSMIERAARDPNVDIDKFERLMAMKDRQVTQGREDAFNEAMAAAQAEMLPVTADSANTQTRSKYASYAALDRAIRPIYTKHGFSISFNTEEGAPQDCIRVVAFVSCKGFTRKYRVDMPADGKGARGGDVMTKTHATGAGMSYGQRYLLKFIFNLAVGNDDDGNAATSGNTLSAEQVQELNELLTQHNVPLDKFLKWAQRDKLADIPVEHFESCKTAIPNYRGKSK